jgi:uncharacterized protein (DUF1778 family)
MFIDVLYPQKGHTLSANLDFGDFEGYNTSMPKLTGRPKKPARHRKAEILKLRLESSEKRAFQDAADIAGIPLSAWLRERARRAAVRELEEAGRRIAFLHVASEDDT